MAVAIGTPVDLRPLVYVELPAKAWRERVDSVRRTRITKLVDGRIGEGPDDAAEPWIRLGPVARWSVLYGAIWYLLGQCGVAPRETLADGGGFT